MADGPALERRGPPVYDTQDGKETGESDASILVRRSCPDRRNATFAAIAKQTLLVGRQRLRSDQASKDQGPTIHSRRAGMPNHASVHDSVHFQNAAAVDDVASDITERENARAGFEFDASAHGAANAKQFFRADDDGTEDDAVELNVLLQSRVALDVVVDCLQHADKQHHTTICRSISHFASISIAL
jgi:hypothetical protein